jgi:uncharacterized membrane protein
MFDKERLTAPDNVHRPTVAAAAAPEVREPESHWPSVVGALAIGVLNYVMPDQLTVGPRWLVFALTSSLLVPALISLRAGRLRLNEILAYAGLAVITLALISSLALLVMRLPAHKDPPLELLRAAGALWVSNTLVFASWYWRLDGGGPNQRDKRGVHTDGAFLFPQMVMDQNQRKQMGEEDWSPGFVDYLFLAFNTSTAFSPTDTPVLSRWAKVLMIVQSIISLTTVALLAARAVNIL